MSKPPGKMPDDADLFRKAMGDVKPIKKGTEKIAIQNKPAVKKISPTISPAPLPLGKNTAQPLSVGQQRGIDSANFERFRRGEMAIDAKLDLHGMTQDKAFLALQDFIRRTHSAGKRCVLIITGKGKSKDPNDMFGKSGVLRDNLPGWLNHAALAPKILAIHQAQPKHGGSGAFYVLLKKIRDQ